MIQVQLRDYQLKIIESLRKSILLGNKKIVVCSPTGSGKTVMFSFVAKNHLSKGGKVLVITDRIKLLKQASGSFAKLNLTPELIVANKEPDLTLSLHVAMCETLSRRSERYSNYIASRTLILIDEAHKMAFEKLFPFISKDCLVLGFTATPYRSGNQSSMDDFYTDLIQEVDTPELIEKGFLSYALSYGVDVDLKGLKKKGRDYDLDQMGAMYGERKVYEGVIENYKRICPGTKTLLFAPNIDSAIKVCEELNAAELPSLILHSEMKEIEQLEVLTKFDKFSNIILVSVGILTTGADFPNLQTIIIYRKIGELPLFLQICGRGSRITETKNKFTILDFGNNIKAHNFWEAPRTWSLKKKERKQGVAPIKTCPKCGAMIAASQMKCGTELPPFDPVSPVYCDHIWITSQKEEQEKEIATLKLLTKKEGMKQAMNATSVKEKAKLAKAKVVSAYWILHRMTDKTEAREFLKEMGYKKSFEYVNKKAFKVFQDETTNSDSGIEASSELLSMVSQQIPESQGTDELQFE